VSGAKADEAGTGRKQAHGLIHVFVENHVTAALSVESMLGDGLPDIG
jgi:hypothetical protein